jgi:branched-chain amino acid transport system ATP-binding protein
MTVLLSARKLCASYGATRVLHGLDFDIAEGGVTVFLGANGAGKTSTLRALSGMIDTTGEVTFARQRVDGSATEKLARLGIAHVPEGRGTFSRMTVEENLQLGAMSRPSLSRRDKTGIAADIDRAYGYFPKLRDRASQQAGTLSGGEQQMLAVARGLMMRPRLMLLDEPSFGLAPLIVEEVYAILRRLNEEEGLSILLVEQNANAALALADHAYLIETGEIVMRGPARDIGRDENVRRAYLGY